MASHNEIVAFLDDFLEIGSFSNYGPNGLLVPGAEEVTKVVTGVSAQRELFEHASRRALSSCSVTTVRTPPIG